MTGWKPYDVVSLGLARTHQIVRPLQELTVLENVVAGSCYGHEQRSLSQAEEIALEVLEFLHLAERRDQLAASLNVAQKKRLEMARALAARPYLLLLDEVLAGLNPTEIAEMVQVVLKIREQGVTILIVEQNIRQALKIATRAYVLHTGRVAMEGRAEDLLANPEIQKAYMGTLD